MGVRSLLIILIAAGLSLTGAGSAMAAGEDVFVVPRVTVAATGENARSAKAAAQINGRRRAMDILLRRLTGEEDWVYLPRLAARAEADAGLGGTDRQAIVLSDQDLQNLESGFEVYNEKSAPKTYRAFITYRFKPGAVRRILREAGIPYSEAQMLTALVIPVLQTKSSTYLWEENNPWLAAWKVRPYNNELTPMIAPIGDLGDARTISAQQALGINSVALARMAERYGVAQVIIAQGYLQQTDGEDKLRVRLINGYQEFEDSDDFLDRISAEDADATQGGFVTQGPTDNNYSVAKIGEVLAEEWFSRPSGNFPLLAEDAIETAIAKYATPWKRRTLIDHSLESLLGVTAYYRSLTEWTKIRSALVGTPLIGSIQVRSLSRRGSELLVRAYGDASKLSVAMEAQGLTLWQSRDDHWYISLPSAGPELRRRVGLAAEQGITGQQAIGTQNSEPVFDGAEKIGNEGRF